MPLSPEQENVTEVILKLTLTPPETIKIKKILVHNEDDQEIEVDADYGEEVTKETLKVDSTTLGEEGENDESITVILEKKNEQAGEEPDTFSEDISLIRVDTLAKHLEVVTKKIHSEGRHEHDIGSNHPDAQNGGAHEKLFYFPQSGDLNSVSCIGYPNYVLRHGLQKWRGDYDAIKGPPHKIPGAALTSGVNYAESLSQVDGWNIYYVCLDNTLLENQIPHNVLDKMNIFGNFRNLNNDPALKNQLIALLNTSDYIYLLKHEATHVGNSLSGVAYEAHWANVGDAVFDNAASSLDFIGQFGFIAVPPQN